MDANILTIEGKQCSQITPSAVTKARGERYMNSWMAHERGKPGFWVLLTKRIYAYRTATGDITFWMAK